MSDNFSKNIKKRTFRAKEMLLETLGKADKTVDERFEESAVNFCRQQKHFEHLQRELLNYVQCLKAVSEASRGYYDAVREAYDNEWTDADHVRAITHSLELLWDDYVDKLTEQSLNPLNAYCSHFVDLKAKIAKRGRKLIDYDGARHAYESMKNSTKRTEESKLLKAEQDLEAARQLYGTLNSELTNELPVLYDGRYSFLINHLQIIFNSSTNFHSEFVKLLEEVQHVVTPKIPLNNTAPGVNHHWQDGNTNTSKEPVENSAVDSVVSSSSVDPWLRLNDMTIQEDKDVKNPFASDAEESPREVSPPSSSRISTTQVQNGVTSTTERVKNDENGDLYPDLSNLKVLYKVRATHRYTAEDTDELSFEAGEVIIVVAFDNPEEQDEGWLMGVIEATGKKGVFPANFTKPL